MTAEWTAVLSDFYNDFSKDLEKAQSDMEGKKVKALCRIQEEPYSHDQKVQE